MDVETLVKLPSNPNVAQVAPGDLVKVTVKFVEAEKQRSQVFQGVVIRVRHGRNAAAFTVRRVTHGVGVERTFMVHSPLLEKVEVLRRSRVRRARLFYLRELSTREARFKGRERTKGIIEPLAAEPVAEAAGPEASEAVPEATAGDAATGAEPRQVGAT